MYCSRPVQRSPSAIRIISRAPRQSRQASYYPSSSYSISPFYARPTAPLDPFRGFERLLDDITSPSFPFAFPQQLQQLQQQHQQQQQLAQYQQAPTFAPRFDVQEQAESYELRGEIPGVEAKDLEVEFRDAQTLVIKGRTETESSSGTRPAPASAQAEQTIAGNEAETQAAETAPEADQSDAASVHSTGSYQKPTVEDATEPTAETADATSVASEAQATPATTPGAEVQAQRQQAPQAPQQQQQQQQQSHYWISERSTGSFQRVFKFPQRVDQEGVTASLKNGVLRVVIPKAAAPEVRRIVVE